MNNNLVDKTYLALELTKLYVQHCNVTIDTDVISSAFDYYLFKLTGIKNISMIENMKKELDVLREENKNLKADLNIQVENTIREKKDTLLTYLDLSSVDMEPSVNAILKDLVSKL